MIGDLNVVLTTGSMNRSASLRRSLNTWLKLDEVDTIIVVDWGSDEPLREVLRDIRDSRLVILRTEDQKYWYNSKCHNLEIRAAANAGLLLRLDNDVLVRKDFFKRHLFYWHRPREFYAGNWRTVPEEIDDKRNISGTLFIDPKYLWAANGYNERLVHYGAEDDDLYARLSASGLTWRELDLETLDHIPHGDDKRFENLELVRSGHELLAQDRNGKPISNMTKKELLIALSQRIARDKPWTIHDRMTRWRLNRVSSNYWTCQELHHEQLPIEDITSEDVFRDKGTASDNYCLSHKTEVTETTIGQDDISETARISLGSVLAPVRVAFVDFHPSFSAIGNSVIHQLRKRFDVVLSDDPDYLFYSVFGDLHSQPKYDKCVKIWWTEENFRPDFTRCDYALTFDYMEDEPRNLRLPLYVRSIFNYQQLTGKSLIRSSEFDAQKILREKSRFCNFVYSNDQAQTRIDFFHKLSKYKSVDSGGSVLNNMGYRADDKLAFIEPYKFTIAFENSSRPGYATEKLVEAMMSNSIPIYWGDPTIGQQFNSRSFVNCHDYASLEEVVEEVIRLDHDDGRFIARLNEPWFIGNQENDYCKADYVISFFEKVFSTKPHSEPKWAGIQPLDYMSEPRDFQ